MQQTAKFSKHKQALHEVQRKKNKGWRKKEEEEKEQMLFSVSKMIRIYEANVIYTSYGHTNWRRKHR